MAELLDEEAARGREIGNGQTHVMDTSGCGLHGVTPFLLVTQGRSTGSPLEAVAPVALMDRHVVRAHIVPTMAPSTFCVGMGLLLRAKGLGVDVFGRYAPAFESRLDFGHEARRPADKPMRVRRRP